MKFDEIIKTRKSIRKYSDKSVDKKIIEEILESARLAPSAVNFQPWQFIVCTNEESKRLVGASYSREWFSHAQVYIIACGNHAQSWKRAADNKDHCDIDVAIAVEHMVLKITELGLATCWVCNFNVEKIREAFALPEEIEPIVLLPIGYPADDSRADERNKKRKSADEIIVWK